MNSTFDVIFIVLAVLISIYALGWLVIGVRRLANFIQEIREAYREWLKDFQEPETKD